MSDEKFDLKNCGVPMNDELRNLMLIVGSNNYLVNPCGICGKLFESEEDANGAVLWMNDTAAHKACFDAWVAEHGEAKLRRLQNKEMRKKQR